MSLQESGIYIERISLAGDLYKRGIDLRRAIKHWLRDGASSMIIFPSPMGHRLIRPEGVQTLPHPTHLKISQSGIVYLSFHPKDNNQPMRLRVLEQDRPFPIVGHFRGRNYLLEILIHRSVGQDVASISVNGHKPSQLELLKFGE